MHSLSLLLSQVLDQGGTKSDKALDKEVSSSSIKGNQFNSEEKKHTYDIDTLL